MELLDVCRLPGVRIAALGASGPWWTITLLYILQLGSSACEGCSSLSFIYPISADTSLVWNVELGGGAAAPAVVRLGQLSMRRLRPIVSTTQRDKPGL